MKSNAIVRIILFTIAILVLLGILITGIAFELFSFDGKVITNSDNSLPVSSDGVTAQGAVDASGVRNLKIEWVAGSITIEPDENATQINLQESGYSGDDYLMVYSLSGDTLKITFCEEDITISNFGISFNANISKDLVITVPAGWVCDSLNIDAAAADVSIRDMAISQVDFDGASGTCEFTNCALGEISMDTASGDLDFSGTLNVLDFDGASADCFITVNNAPRKIEIDSASGDLELYLPEECGFSCSMDGLSNSYYSDFPYSMRNGCHVYGDGSCIIDVDALSGDVSIRKHSISGGASSIPSPLCSDPSCTDVSYDHSHINAGEDCIIEDCSDDSHSHESKHSGSNHH